MAQLFGGRKKNKKNKKKNQISACSVPSYRIDLQISPFHRWSAIIKTYRKQIKKLIESILSLEQFQCSSDDEAEFQKKNNENEQKEKMNFFESLTQGVFESLNNLGGSDYVKEIKGIAHILQSDGILVEHVLLSHLLYESFCGCTSIISDSKILGRTLDWMDFDDQLLRNLTIDIEVFDGSKYLYRFTTFCGYIGALTALRFDSFGFAINFREFSSNESSDDNDNECDKWPIGLLGRYICEHCKNYESAAKMWNNSPLMAPTYVLLSGHKESMQITRDETESIKPIKMKKKGYILQTNIDHWTKGKKIKDTMDSVKRLNVARKCLKECSNELNEEAMWNILYKYPIHDKHWTIYSTVMNVKSEYYETKRHLYKT